MGRRSKKRRKVIKKVSGAAREIKLYRSFGFPNCRGLYPDCPEEIDPDNPPKDCLICPVYSKL